MKTRIDNKTPLESFDSFLKQDDLENSWNQFQSIICTDDVFKLDFKSHYSPLVDLIINSGMISESNDMLNIIVTSLNDMGVLKDFDYYLCLLKIYEFQCNSEKVLEIDSEIGTLDTFAPISLKNSIISTLFKTNHAEKAISLFKDVEIKNLDSETFFIMIKGCLENDLFENVDSYWTLMQDLKLPVDPRLHSLMISYWCESNRSEIALSYTVSLESLDVGVLGTCLSSLLNGLFILRKHELVVEISKKYESNLDLNSKITLIKSLIALKDFDSALIKFSNLSTSESLNEYNRLEIYQELISEAQSNSDLDLAKRAFESLSSDNLVITPVILNSMISILVEKSMINEALEFFSNYKRQCEQKLLNLNVPTTVYDLLMNGLSRQFRLTEFTTLWNEAETSGDVGPSTFHIALNTYISVKDVPKAFKVCKTIMNSDDIQKPTIKVLLDLFESAAITSKYREMIQILEWIRSTRSVNEELNNEISKLVLLKIAPLSQSIEKFLTLSMADSVNGEFKSSAMTLFQEFLALNVALPYSLFKAVIVNYHASKDMVGVAKTMGLAIKQSRGKDGNPLNAECVAAFLEAARDLCGKTAASSVLKLVFADNLKLNEVGYKSLLVMASKFGWFDEISRLFQDMSISGIIIDSKLYGQVDANLKKNGHEDVASLLATYMERTFPEVIGSWLEFIEFDVIAEMKRLRD